MALTTPEQLKTLLSDKKHILLTFSKKGSTDAIAGTVALAMYIKKLGKQVDIISDEFSLPKKISFLKETAAIKPQFPHLRKFIITLDVKDSGIQELSYDVKDDKLQIYITPKQGFLNRDGIRTAQTDFRYDLIMTIGTPDLASLGSLYANNTDLFYTVPVVNIDYKSANEHFGHLNIIDITASSTSELIYQLLTEMGEETKIDKDMANALLTGMIAATQSFKTDNMKPKTLTNASKLMTLGADRQYIISQLYQTKTLASLKLWGQALAHLEYDKTIGLAYTALTREDFARSGAQEEELYDIIDELIANSPEAKMVLLVHEHSGESTVPTIHAILHTGKAYNASRLLAAFKPEGNGKRTSCVITNMTLGEAVEKIKEQIHLRINEEKSA